MNSHTISKLLLIASFLLVSIPTARADGPAAGGPVFGQDQKAAAPAAGGTTQTSAPSAPPQGNPLMSMLPILLMFGVVYFLMIRPQQKRAKEQQSMITALKHGDEVVTSSGLLGKVTGIADKVVTVEVDTNVRIKMLKSQIQQVIKGQIKDLA